MSESMTVSMDDVETVVSWWRAANEAPGGCSPLEAINGMKDAIWNLEQARRKAGGRPL